MLLSVSYNILKLTRTQNATAYLLWTLERACVSSHFLAVWVSFFIFIFIFFIFLQFSQGGRDGASDSLVGRNAMYSFLSLHHMQAGALYKSSLDVDSHLASTSSICPS